MENSEIVLGHWLTRQRCHWVYIDQSPNIAAEGVRGIEGREVLHRPDLVALIDGVGSIAIDVKQYEFKRRGTLVYSPAEDKGSWSGDPEAYIPETDDVSFEIDYVKLVWPEMLRLAAFSKISTIPVWLCIMSEKDMVGEKAFFYRVDEIIEAFSWIFQSKAKVRALHDWPEVNLAPDSAIPSSEDAFEFIVENEDIVSVLHWAECRAYVIPRVLDLRSKSSVLNLVRVMPARKVVEGSVSTRQIALANKIAETLNIKLPSIRNKRALGTFINKHKVRWEEVVRRV